MSPLFEFTADNVSSTLAWTGNLIGSAMPLLVVILGVAIALWILGYFFKR